MIISQLIAFLSTELDRIGDVPVVFVRIDEAGDAAVADRVRVDVVSLAATTGEISVDGETALASMICLCEKGSHLARLFDDRAKKETS